MWRALAAVVLLASILSFDRFPVAAQDDEMPGVRGNLFESPTFGWLLLLPEDSGWRFVASDSDRDGDYVQAMHASGAMGIVVSYQDAGDASACAQGLLDTLAEHFPDATLQGETQPELSIQSTGSTWATVVARVPDPENADEDVHASITCQKVRDELLLGSMSLYSGDNGATLPLPKPPAQGNTGHPIAAGTPLDAGTGVVLFAAQGKGALDVGFPFTCAIQDEFVAPSASPPPGMGYFPCQGQAINVDVSPVTLDLGNFALGCLPGLPIAPDAGECPEAPVRASHAQVLDTSTGQADGATVTLDPGEYADLMLWFVLPEGLPPSDVLYLDGDRTYQVGPTFFTQGTGSRPRVRMTR